MAEFHDVAVARAFAHIWQRSGRRAVSRVGSPGLARAADLTTKAATSAPTAGRVMYAGMRSLPVPSDPVARLWHSATMLREHRGDGHVAALVGARIGGTEAHVLSALEMGIHPPESFGRIHHLPKKWLAEVMDGLRERVASERGELAYVECQLPGPPCPPSCPARLPRRGQPSAGQGR